MHLSFFDLVREQVHELGLCSRTSKLTTYNAAQNTSYKRWSTRAVTEEMWRFSGCHECPGCFVTWLPMTSYFSFIVIFDFVSEGAYSRFEFSIHKHFLVYLWQHVIVWNFLAATTLETMKLKEIKEETNVFTLEDNYVFAVLFIYFF